MVHLTREPGQQLLVYPNPTAGQFTVELPAASVLPEELLLRNALGQVVLRQKISEEQSEITLPKHLPDGVYYLVGDGLQAVRLAVKRR